MQKYLYQDLYELEDKHWWHINKRKLVEFFIRKNLQNKTDNILDVGCGTGKNIESLSTNWECWGIDVSPEAIAFCKKRGIKTVIKGSLAKIPFPKQSFSGITVLDVLEHVDDTEALQEIYRVLKKNGIVIITVPAFSWLWSRWDEVLQHKRRYTKKTLQKILQENKFKILKISYIYSFLILPAFFIRQVKNILFKDSYPSDFKLSSPVINYLFACICKIENFFITFANLPFGASLIAVAYKK